MSEQIETLAKRFDSMSEKGFNQSESEFEKGYNHAFAVAARVLHEAAPEADLERAVVEAAVALSGQMDCACFKDWADISTARAGCALLEAVDTLIAAREKGK